MTTRMVGVVALAGLAGTAVPASALPLGTDLTKLDPVSQAKQQVWSWPNPDGSYPVVACFAIVEGLGFERTHGTAVL